MESVSPSSYLPARSSSNQNYGVSQRASVHATLDYKSATNITLVTKEGDRVTLSSRDIFSAAYSAEQGSDANGSYAKLAAGAARLSSSSITVEGDLNEQEQKDIEHAVGEIKSVMSDLLAGGDLNAAFERLRKLGGELGTVSEYDASSMYSIGMTTETNVQTDDRRRRVADDSGVDQQDENQPLDFGALQQQIDKILNRFGLNSQIIQSQLLPGIEKQDEDKKPSFMERLLDVFQKNQTAVSTETPPLANLVA